MHILLQAQDGSRFTVQPDSAEYKVIEDAWKHAVALFGTSRGWSSIGTFIKSYNPHPRDLDERYIAFLLRTFLLALTNKSPTIILRQHWNSTVVGYHERKTWQGTPAEFDLQGQVVHIHRSNIDFIINASVYQEQQSQLPSQNPDQLFRSNILLCARFKVVHMLTHEIFHILITFLGNGRVWTPNHLTHNGAYTVGEGGEYGENLLYGGLIDFFMTGDDQDAYGLPFLITTQYEARQIPAWTLANWLAHGTLYRGDSGLGVDVNSPALSVSGDFHNRPFIVGMMWSSRVQSYREWAAGNQPYDVQAQPLDSSGNPDE